MNKNNIEYLVMFGSDRYHPDLHVRACRNRFDFIREARGYASGYETASIFKCRYDKYSGDLVDIREVI